MTIGSKTIPDTGNHSRKKGGDPIKKWLFAIITLPILPFILFIVTDQLLQVVPRLKSIRAVEYFLEHPSEYLSILSILATVMIAVMIYQLQQKNEARQREREQQHARGVLFDSVLLAIQQAQRYVKVHRFEDHFGQDVKAVRITEGHFTALSKVPKELATQEDAQNFQILLSELEKIHQYEAEEAYYELYYVAKDVMKKLFIPAYYIYREETAEPMNLLDFLNPKYRDVFLKVGYSSKENHYVDRNNKKILALNKNHTWNVFDAEGNQIARSILVDSNGIKEGYGVYNDRYKGRKYVGYWRDYKKHGKGEEYVDDYFSREEVLDKSGTWKEDEFLQGMLYNRLIHKVFKEKEQLPEDVEIAELDGRGNIYTDQIVHLSYEKDIYIVEEYVMDYKQHAGVIAKRAADEVDGIPNLVEHLSFDERLFEGLVYQDMEVQGKRIPIEHCPEGITQEEVNQYNKIFDKIPRKIKQYNQELEIYQHIQAYGKEITLNFTNQNSVDIDRFEVEVISPPELLIMEGTKNIQGPPPLPREFNYASFNLVKRELPIKYIIGYLIAKETAEKNNRLDIPEVYEDLDYEVADKRNHSSSVVQITNTEHLKPGQSTKDNQTFIITPLASGEYVIKFNCIIGDDYSSRYTDYVRVVVQEI